MEGKLRRRRTELEKKAVKKKKKTRKLSQEFHMGEYKNFKLRKEKMGEDKV